MLFNSIAFIFFLPTVFFLHWLLVKQSQKNQNLILLLASYFFYGSWDWRFLGLIVFSSFVDFSLGKKIYNEKGPKKKKKWLITSITINLLLLIFFKYYNFFADSFYELFQFIGITVSPFTLKILLPVGISFYTFQTMSYTIDIYRGKMKPTNSALAFFTFVGFFPQLVAGPIERAADLVPQFLRKRSFSYKNAVSGIRLILWGLFKKVVVADTLAILVNHVYDNPGTASSWQIILALLFFSIQVYCDFSGYSDLAIGTAKMFNINLSTNFKTPFFSKSMKEFWARWHITLSTWFRDYIYIPLGGNKSTEFNWHRNLFLVMLISGLWHGASWNFVIWGALHGFFLVGENILKPKIPSFLIRVNKRPWLPVWNLFSIIYTFSAFTGALLLFRAKNLDDVSQLLNGINTVSLINDSLIDQLQLIYEYPTQMITMGISLLILGGVDFIIRNNSIDHQLNKLARKSNYVIYTLTIIWLLFAGTFSQPQEFVYFQF